MKRVVITGTDPNFNHACSAEPQPGTKGDALGPGPGGKIAVQFIPTDIGYESNRDEDDRITLYIRSDLVKEI